MLLEYFRIITRRFSFPTVRIVKFRGLDRYKVDFSCLLEMAGLMGSVLVVTWLSGGGEVI